MRRAHVLLGTGLASAVASAILASWVAYSPSRPARSGTPAVRETASSPRDPGAPLPQLVMPVGLQERAAILDPAHSCDVTPSQLAAERAMRLAAEQEVAKLREELDRVTDELRALRFPEDTPYGAFLASPEADEIKNAAYLREAILEDLRTDIERAKLRMAKDPSPANAHLLQVLSNRLERFSAHPEEAVDSLFRYVKATLEVFPVRLRPGEATWLAERLASGGVRNEDLVGFLGVDRVASELPLPLLFDEHLWDPDYGRRLEAALSPEQRTELSARLNALMEGLTDPEEIRSLRERFPTYFE